MPTDTIVHRLFAQAQTRGTHPALYVKEGGAWKAMTYAEYAAEVRRAGKALIALGMGPGENTSILGKNRPEWVVLALASMSVGGASAGIYTTSSPSEVRYIVDHAESKVMLVENAEQFAKVEKELERMPKLQHIVLMRGVKVEHPKALTWEAFLEKGDAVGDDQLQQRLDAIDPEGLAVLIYTSGTTGPPKGVMLPHRALTWVATFATTEAKGKPEDCLLSYLPLSHIAEQVFTIHGPITMGGSVYFAESMEKLPDNLKEVQPTIFFGVPRVWEKFHAGISGKLALATGVKKALVGWARGVGTAMTGHRCRGTQPSMLLSMQYGLANKLVFSKLKQAIGLSRARFCVSGAAPIAKEVLDLLGSLDVLVLEVYGQSEGSGPTSFNLPGRARLGSVGPVCAGCEMKIASDGEILVRGPNIFLGYYKDPAATAETLIDGWLHSGDLGAIGADGCLSITGRKKEILITAGGKNIAPKNIEAALKNHRLIGEAVIIGDRRKFLSCVLTLDPEAAAAFAKEKGLKPEQLHESAEVRAELQRAVDGVNEEMARVEQVKKFVVLEKPLSIEGGELTPTLKVKRKVVNEKYAAQIEAMYAE